jgi:hypothetical protein
VHILIVLRQLQKVNLKIVGQHETVTAVPQSKIEMQIGDAGKQQRIQDADADRRPQFVIGV